MCSLKDMGREELKNVIGCLMGNVEFFVEHFWNLTHAKDSGEAEFGYLCLLNSVLKLYGSGTKGSISK